MRQAKSWTTVILWLKRCETINKRTVPVCDWLMGSSLTWGWQVAKVYRIVLPRVISGVVGARGACLAAVTPLQPHSTSHYVTCASAVPWLIATLPVNRHNYLQLLSNLLCSQLLTKVCQFASQLHSNLLTVYIFINNLNTIENKYTVFL